MQEAHPLVTERQATPLKTGARSWAGAEEKKRELEAQLTGQHTPAQNTAPRTLTDAVEIFMADKKSQGVTADVLGRYERELARLRNFAERKGIFTAARLSRELLIAYKADWEDLYPSGNTQASVQARLKNFLRFCFDSRWMDRIPKLSRVKVDEIPTLPLTEEEYKRLLDTVPVSFPNPRKALRVRALIRMMRHSGLAIVDRATLRRDDLIHNKVKALYRIVTARQKTGTDVTVPIPPDVARELLTVLNGNPTYVFWTGNGEPRTTVSHWQEDFRTLYRDARIAAGESMMNHRLRDTFAVDLLERGVPLEEVSKLLAHQSIKTTERHYAQWVKARQDRLDALVIGAWTK